jgi:hypothetical protein
MELVLVTTIVAFGKINRNDLLGQPYWERCWGTQPHWASTLRLCPQWCSFGVVAGRPIGSTGEAALAQ